MLQRYYCQDQGLLELFVEELCAMEMATPTRTHTNPNGTEANAAGRIMALGEKPYLGPKFCYQRAPSSFGFGSGNLFWRAVLRTYTSS